MKKELIDDLQRIGLTSGESKVYLAVQYMGESKVSDITREANVSNSKVYDILERLINKGLISYTNKNNIKYFIGLNTNRLNDYIKEKEIQIKKQKQIIKNVIPHIYQNPNKNKKTGDIEIYENISGLKSISEKIIDELNENDTIYIIGAGQEYIKQTKGFFTQWQEKRVERNIKFKGLYTKDNLNILQDRKNIQLSQIKILPEEIIAPVQLVITPYFIINIITQPKIKCITIYGKEIADSYKIYFNNLWDKSENF